MGLKLLNVFGELFVKLGKIHTYSKERMKPIACLFMKQNCHFDRGLAQHKHATPPLSFSGIITTLLISQGAQKLPAVKV